MTTKEECDERLAADRRQREAASTTPVMLHAGGSECHHEGPAQRMADDEAGAACSAGIEITHVRFNGADMPVAEVVHAMTQVGQNLGVWLNAMITQLAGVAERLADSPAMRIIAKAAAAVEAERQRAELAPHGDTAADHVISDPEWSDADQEYQAWCTCGWYAEGDDGGVDYAIGLHRSDVTAAATADSHASR